MKITPVDMDIAKYALKKRIEGYKLLKNPKGTPKTQVSMIKTDRSFNEYNDYVELTTRIRKDFSLPERPEETDSLYTVKISKDGRTLSDARTVLYVPLEKRFAESAQKTHGIIPENRPEPEHNSDFYSAQRDIILNEESKHFYKSKLEKYSENFPYNESIKTQSGFFRTLFNNLKKENKPFYLTNN